MTPSPNSSPNFKLNSNQFNVEVEVVRVLLVVLTGYTPSREVHINKIDWLLKFKLFVSGGTQLLMKLERKLEQTLSIA